MDTESPAIQWVTQPMPTHDTTNRGTIIVIPGEELTNEMVFSTNLFYTNITLRGWNTTPKPWLDEPVTRFEFIPVLLVLVMLIIGQYSSMTRKA